MYAATTNVDIALIVAIILFSVAGIIAALPPYRSPVAALTAFGLAVFALAFVINP